MRFLARLNRSYTPAQSVVLLLASVFVVLATPLALAAVGLAQSVAAPVALALALGTFFAAAAVIDRRQARKT